jgi:hypothetical protein
MTMKYISFTLIALFFSAFTFGQEPSKDKNFIEVSGVAEMEIEPNEIYLVVRLQEFEENREKTSLEKLDQSFLAAIKAAGIDRKNIELANIGSDLEKLRKRDKDAFREKTYQVKVSSASELEKLIEKLEPVKAAYANIERVDHTEMEKFKIDLKVKALQAARTKAETLLKSIGAEIGKPIMVREWDYAPVYPMARMNANVMMDAASQVQETETSFRKITLREQVTAQFEIR